MAFRSLAILSALLLAVLAQTSSDSLVPAGISPGCSSYITSLNQNTSLAACTTQLTTALQQYAPSASTTPSSSAINSTLDKLCATTSNECPQNTVTSLLGSFYAACSVELTSAPNPEVKIYYDLLYAFLPSQQAVCSRDNNGNYCAAEISSWNPSSGAQSVLSQYLYSSSPTSNTTFSPNTTTFTTFNLLFMFLQPSTPSSALCSSCTRSILSSYITFESTSPYAPGINSSLLLSGQVDLYNTITAACGSAFLSGAVQAAGGLSSGLVNGATPRAGGHELSAAVGVILGVAALMAVPV